jgi:hypothetical protein
MKPAPIGSMSDAKTKRRYDFILEHMRIIEEICLSKADASASEMLREKCSQHKLPQQAFATGAIRDFSAHRG